MKTSNTAASTTLSMPKKLAFYGIALLIPIVFFLLLEGALRLVGYGKDVPLFIENPANPHYLLPRPDVMRRYFPDDAPKPSVTLEANFFLKDKPENGLRIFVQGGSTAAGFPYGLGASLAASLDQRLKQALPGKHVEVVGTALSAVNSYTLLDFADEIIEQSPDAILIYAGHNEYLGVFGVGSNYSLSNARFTTLWFIRLKHLRTFQLIQSLFFASQHALASEASEDQNSVEKRSRTLMSQVAKQKEIVKDSPLFDSGIKQFERNMALLLDKYQAADIPVFIATLASNQSEQAPFASVAPAPEHLKLIEQVLADVQSKDPQAAKHEWTKLSAALAPSKSANLHFELGHLLIQQGMHDLAKSHFMLAIEHDVLRFRAPEATNTLIRKLAKRDNVYLVDTLRAFEQRSPKQIIGKNLMLEHLHPNLQGYYVLSESFYQSLKASDLFNPWQDISIDKAWRERLVLPAEEYFGFATILKLTSDYPFTDSPKPLVLPPPADWQQALGKEWFEKRINWQQMMERSLSIYRERDDAFMAFKTLQILADALPHNGLYSVQLAEQMLKQQRLSEALYYYRRASLAGAINDDIERKISLIEAQLTKHADK